MLAVAAQPPSSEKHDMSARVSANNLILCCTPQIWRTERSEAGETWKAAGHPIARRRRSKTCGLHSRWRAKGPREVPIRGRYADAHPRTAHTPGTLVYPPSPRARFVTVDHGNGRRNVGWIRGAAIHDVGTDSTAGLPVHHSGGHAMVMVRR